MRGWGENAAGASSADSAAATAAESAAQSAPASEAAESSQSADASSEEAAGNGRPARTTEPLLVYLNDFDAVIGDMFKEATGYEVEVVVGNGAETMSRIEAEKSNPQWDVVWLDSMYDIYNLSLDGSLLTDWEPENAANLTEFSKPWYPTTRASIPPVPMRPAFWSTATTCTMKPPRPSPSTILTDPAYADQVGMADPGVAAPAYPLAAGIMYEKGMDGGQEFFNTLFQQGLKVYPKNPQVVQALASGRNLRSAAAGEQRL